VSYPNSRETYEALMKLEFLVVSELFMTPTAALADIVLPAAWGMEHEEVGYWPGWYEEMRAHPKIVDPPGECWPDTKILNELAKRLGMKEDFWEDDHEALDLMLEPSGMTYEQFKKKRVILPKREYRKHDYRTPSGKIVLYSEEIKRMGYSPMPLWKEVSAIPQPTNEYPLLLTNAKEEAYMLSSYKSVASMRMMRPDPMIEMNPETAEKLGLKEGDWVDIETSTGKIKQKLALNKDLDPCVIMAAFGWWFPEDATPCFGWSRANLNILTPSGPDYDPTTGGVALRGIPCKVSRAEA
jgi:anaerobic selenocysteine-containing dehydrogenase